MKIYKSRRNSLLRHSFDNQILGNKSNCNHLCSPFDGSLLCAAKNNCSKTGEGEGGSSVNNVICDDTVFMITKNIYEKSK